MISLQAERVAILRAIRDEHPTVEELASRFGLSTNGSWSAPRVTRSEPFMRGAIGVAVVTRHGLGDAAAAPRCATHRRG